jgi:hypothetical protein
VTRKISNRVNYDFNTELVCIARGNKGSLFSFWTSDLGTSKNDQINRLTVNQSGELIANFIRIAEVPYSTLGAVYSIISNIIFYIVLAIIIHAIYWRYNRIKEKRNMARHSL